ncbi:PEP-CTERM sorting domain-containing protein [Coraliomargarita sp. SDUM461003]|uniref:PEP-CTERM sorting domain-containing protein n=1 Tax=Thalassobacterium maritimum TaxID=3041265 RepID=A0ABU1AQ52_9BACT|nr:PEP-CTERM sorting domain-containing protein [Coraliomargarita sp. SDUM461003]MDQ8206306.1 PEP-CTERM sorting domain-containing protein [Coraliomargarita sp. SDUM461003]
MPTTRTPLFAVGFLFCVATGSSHAATILSTDFSGRTVTGNIASEIAYVTNGVSNPGDLTVTQATGITGSGLNGLFNTTQAQGFFAPDLNTGNQGNWTFSVPITLTVSSIMIDEVELDGAMFDNNGNLQVTSPRSTSIKLSIVGSSSGEVFFNTLTASNPSTNAAWSAPLTYTPSVTLTNAETWNIVFTTTNGADSGNNTGVDSFTVSGTAIPEPSAAALLLGLAACGLVARRRRS